MRQHTTKTRMTFEEVRRMLDDFYDEVEAKEKSEGVTLHVIANRPDSRTLMGRLRRLFKCNNH